MDLKFRHEIKHTISYIDQIELRQRLSAVMKKDANTKDGLYEIRSIYFDNLDDKALQEKINGSAKREKFRIRYYNGNTNFIRLEKKSKIGSLCNKQSCIISREETNALLNGDISWMLETDRPLIKELYTKMLSTGLKPKTIVDYTREAFVFKSGNVRVTLDYNIRTGKDNIDFLNWNSNTLPTDNKIILEVKWDEFLPDIIKDLVQLENRHSCAYSKYAACRVYN